MTDPVLHLIVGPNGAGKSTLHEAVIGPVTNLEFVNADVIAAQRWPEAPADHAYEAARLAAGRRAELIAGHSSFVTETVFSHDSKLGLVRAATSAGYLVTLHIVVVPEALAVARVHNRVAVGGHDVPDDKIRGRFRRLWPLVADAIGIVDHATAYDNSSARDPFRVVANFHHGRATRPPTWPAWTPGPLLASGDPPRPKS